MGEARSVEELVEEQVQRWQRRRPAAPESSWSEPVVAISRMPGCGGRALAQELAGQLGFDFFGKEILHRVAQDAHLSERILKTVDEKALPALSAMFESLFLGRFLGGEYIHHLSKVLLAVAQHGRAVILGRGAAFILPPALCLRVLLIAPREERVCAVMSQERLPRADAERKVVRLESERRAFIRRNFHEEALDPFHYDLTVNTAGLRRDAILEAIRAAWAGKRREAPAVAGARP